MGGWKKGKPMARRRQPGVLSHRARRGVKPTGGRLVRADVLEEAGGAAGAVAAEAKAEAKGDDGAKPGGVKDDDAPKAGGSAK